MAAKNLKLTTARNLVIGKYRLGIHHRSLRVLDLMDSNQVLTGHQELSTRALSISPQ